MRYLRGKHHHRAAIIEVAIIEAGKYREHKDLKNPVLRGVNPYRALIDTGATATMISTKVVRELNLESIGRIPFRHMNGITYQSSYLFHVAFLEGGIGNSNLEMNDGDHHILQQYSSPVKKIFVFPKVIEGAEITAEQSFDVLLGMDVITSGELRIKPDGEFEFVF